MALTDIKKNESLIENFNIKSPETNPNSYSKLQFGNKSSLANRSIHLNSTFSLELSHHKGRKILKKLQQ